MSKGANEKALPLRNIILMNTVLSVLCENSVEYIIAITKQKIPLIDWINQLQDIFT